MRIFTIGHSTRSLEELVDMLRGEGICQLGDVRSFPGSRKFPHFNQESLQESLPAAGIRYFHLKELGGYRRIALEDSPNAGWRSQGFRNYADHMLSEEFRKGITRLMEIAREDPTAIMCAEATPWRCHRQLVSDYLVGLLGTEVIHILHQDQTQKHELSTFARVEPHRLIYPPIPD